MAVQYRCIICQNVFPTVIAWREHARTTYGEDVFQQAGFTADPYPETVVDMTDDRQRAAVERGIIEVLAGRYTGRNGPYGFSGDVKTAIRALYIKDDDPYWMMSDDGSIRPKAALTDAGAIYARERKWLVPCADHVKHGGACNRETLAPDLGGNERCTSCRSSLIAPSVIDGLPFCGSCVVTIKRRTIPGWVIPPELRGRR